MSLPQENYYTVEDFFNMPEDIRAELIKGQIIAVLNKSGYVRSTRGAQGGYQLVKKPQEYTVGMILRLTEGSLAPVECLAENALPCERNGRCATVEVYKRIYNAINDVIDNITVQDLLEIEKGKASDYYVI